LIDKTLTVDKKIYIGVENANQPQAEIQYNGKRGGIAMITIADGGDLTVDGIIFNGAEYQGNGRPMSGISPAAKMSGTYSAWIGNCVFKQFAESSFAGFKAIKNSFADTILFYNCKFQDISGEGIGLGAEKNDDGKYSAENIWIEDCEFDNILGCAVNIYRGGTDESTAGPALEMQNCVFNYCNNQERGAALRLIGVQQAHLDGLVFKNSGKGGAAIKFDECQWDDIRLGNILYENSGKLRKNSLYQ
jgi:poly(beta-D-mannuronate) lyase